MINDWSKNNGACLFTLGWICPTLRIAVQTAINVSLYRLPLTSSLYNRPVVASSYISPIPVSLYDNPLLTTLSESSIVVSTHAQILEAVKKDQSVIINI